MTDSIGKVHISLVMAKTKVAPIKRLTIPRLELCGPHLLARVLTHVKRVLEILSSEIFAWTYSTIVLNWLRGNPTRFTQFVDNRVSVIMSLIPPERWSHVNGVENPAHCPSRGVFSAELMTHNMWWSGPDWLKLPPSEWSKRDQVSVSALPDERYSEELCHHTYIQQRSPVIPLDRYCDFNHLKRLLHAGPTLILLK